MFIAMAPVLVPAAVWIYTLVFAFSSLWFAHYSLAMLEKLRKAPPAGPAYPSAPSDAESRLAEHRAVDRP